METGQTPAFELQGVSFSYRDTTALQTLSLSIQHGTRVALIGANGSGKSTLVRLLAGLSFPDEGSLTFFGEPLTQVQLNQEEFFLRFRRRVGLVFQNSDIQLFNASVFEEVAFAPLQLGLPKEEVRRRVDRTLDQLGITHLANRAPHRLSGGEKKRVAIASVLVSDPEILLLDEPVAGLDPGSQTQMLELLTSWKDSARTVIIATHELSALENIADRCLLLHRGTLAADADPLTILHDIALLTRTGLVRPHRHTHDADSMRSHPPTHTHQP